jgi:hypothetical protein
LTVTFYVNILLNRESRIVLRIEAQCACLRGSHRIIRSMSTTYSMSIQGMFLRGVRKRLLVLGSKEEKQWEWIWWTYCWWWFWYNSQRHNFQENRSFKQESLQQNESIEELFQSWSINGDERLTFIKGNSYGRCRCCVLLCNNLGKPIKFHESYNHPELDATVKCRKVIFKELEDMKNKGV